MRLRFKESVNQAEIEENGFVKIPFLNADEVQSLRKFYNDGIKDAATGFHCTMFNPDVDYRKAVDNAIKEVFAKRISENIENAKMLYANFMVKEDGADSDFYVHQDWTYVDESRSSSWALWVPLADTNATNGALHVVPKTHRMSNKYRGPGVTDALEGLHEVIREEFAQPVEMKAGEAVIWNHRLVHFSPANLSGKNRVAATVILVPNGESVIHCRGTETSGEVNIFEVGTDFYMNYSISEPPKLPVTETLGVDTPVYSKQDFRSLVRNDNQKRSILQKVINLFNG